MIFIVPGFPRGKGRARSFAKQTKSGKVISGQYPDDKTVVYEAQIRQAFVTAFPNFLPIGGAVILTVMAYFPIPKSASKIVRSQMIDGLIRPMRKPDLSNIEKAVEDALNTVAFTDDAHVIGRGGDEGKYYTNGMPRLEVYIHEWDSFV